MQLRAVVSNKDAATEQLFTSENQLKATQNVRDKTLYEMEERDRHFQEKGLKLVDEVSDAEGSVCFLKDIRNGVAAGRTGHAMIQSPAATDAVGGGASRLRADAVGGGASRLKMIHDCELTPWEVEHPCSQTCDPTSDRANFARPGRKSVIRHML